MPQFPSTEAEVVALADQMVAGFTAHAADFPSVTVASLTTALNNYKSQKTTQDNAKGQAQIATVTKDEKLDVLVELMKNDLKVSEVDTTGDPEKLYEIGWGPKAGPQPVALPGAPSNLRSMAEGQGWLMLAWERPASSSGGPVRNYIVERCQQAQGGEVGEWTFAGTTYNCDIRLVEQPVDVRLEYRVRASNTSGESAPSNSVVVTLP